MSLSCFLEGEKVGARPFVVEVLISLALYGVKLAWKPNASMAFVC